MGDKPLFIKKRRFGLFWTIFFLAFATGVVGFILFFIGNKGEIAGVKVYNIIAKPAGNLVFVDPETGGDRDRIIIMVMGLDESRDDRGMMHHKGSRTDTIFLLGLDRKAERLGVLSIPRDTWLKVSDKIGENRINTAYREAFWEAYESNGKDYEKAKAAGIAQAIKTAQSFLNVKVDYFVLLKIKAASEMVDALGGIMVDVEKDMDYDDNWGHLHIHLKKGYQRLNGMQAVGYSRFRHDEEGDWGRIRRQQQVIQALVSELKKPTHIMHIDKIAKIIKSNVDTNLDLNQLIDLARSYKEFDKAHIAKGVIAGEDEMIEGNMVIKPDEAQKKRVVDRLLKDPAEIKPEEVYVRVLNGCGVHGLGAKAADLLKQKGYNVVEIGNADKENLAQSVIYDHFISGRGSEKIKTALKLESSRIVHQKNKNGDPTLDYTVILGKDSVKVLMPGDGEESPEPEPESSR